MAKIHYNKQNQVDMPTLRIQNRNFDTLGNGTINKYVSEFTYKQYFNSANEASFKVYKKVDSVINPIWDYILDCKILDIDEYAEKYEIKVTPLIDENGLYKNVTCTDLAVSELSQVHLYTIEINTTDDIARTDYDANFPTLFYRVPDISFYDWTDNKYANYTDEQKLAVIKGSSLLHRLLEKAYNYSIVHVDSSLANLKKIASFSIDDTTIYDELTGEISDEYGVLFKFDSVNRTVSAYDLYNTCNTCGYRGDFSDVCPECGSTDFGGQYGNDTTICINDTNLATQIQRESDVDSLKNTFRVEGGDDIITAAIASVNPNGSNYIYYFSPDVMADMTEELVTGLNNYNALYTEYQTTHEYSLSADGVTNYNSVINYIKTYFPDSEYTTISSPMTGYSATSTLLYDTIDLKAYLQTSMMPTITVDNLTIEETMALLVASNLSPIAVTNPSTAVQSIADNAVLGMAKVLVNTALYTVEISESEYTSGTTGTWIGKFKLTSIEYNTSTLIGDLITLSVTSDVETYIKQKIDKLMAKSDIDEALDLSNMDMTLDTFKSRLHYYSIDYLKGLHTEFESVRDGIILSNKDTMADLYTNFYSTYNNRVVAIDAEIVTRTTQLGYINAIYDEVESLRSTVKSALNLQSYLGSDLWKTFCSYRREDKYSNANYISDGLTNVAVIARVTELFKTAQRELYKAGTMQYSMTTTMNNLLMIDEFKDFADDFEVGNWLNVQFDDVNYRLRLLSYEINFENLEQINVEFSTVSKIWSGTSDVKSVIDSARSIAGSYSNTTQQVNKSAEATNKVSDWVDNGLDVTNTKIVNDAVYTTVGIDKNGISIREHDDITDTYSPTQAKVLPSGIYVTDDAWESVKTALGKYVYLDPVDSTTKTTFGIIGSTIVGQLMLSEKTVITNGDGSITLDHNGIKMINSGGFYTTNGTYSVEIDPNHTLSDKTMNGYLMCIRNGETVIMGVDTTGKGYFSGKIICSLGEIGGFDIGDTYISNGTTSLAGAENSVYTGTDGISCGTKFKVTKDGAVNMLSGYIGGTNGWAISDGLISSTNGQIKLTSSTDNNKFVAIKDAGFVSSGSNAGKQLRCDLSQGAIVGINRQNNSILETYAGHLMCYDEETKTNFSFSSGLLSFNINAIDGDAGDGVFSIDDTGDFEVEKPITIQSQMKLWSGAKLQSYDIYDNILTLMYLNTVDNIHINYADTAQSKDLYLHLSGGTNQVGFLSNKIIPTDNAVSLGDSIHRLTTVYATNGTIQTSDRNKKREIKEILPIYEEVFMRTVPVQYMFNDGDRIHFGVISQDFEELLHELNLTDLDCAAFCKDIHYIYDKDDDGNDIESTKRPELDKDGNIVYDYSFRYSEFIMLTVHMVQKTIKRVDTLEETVQIQETNIEELHITIKAQQDVITSLEDENTKLKEIQDKHEKLIQALCEKVGLDPTSI